MNRYPIAFKYSDFAGITLAIFIPSFIIVVMLVRGVTLSAFFFTIMLFSPIFVFLVLKLVRTKIILLNENDVKIVLSFRSYIVQMNDITEIQVNTGWRGNKRYSVYSDSKLLFCFDDGFDDSEKLYSILNSRKMHRKKNTRDFF